MKKTLSSRNLILIMIIVGVVILSVFYYINQHPQDPFYDIEDNTTVVSELLARDMYRNYPSTARNVVELYNEIMEAMYNEEYTDNELMSLMDMMRELYDTEFLDNNPRMTQYYSLVSELNAAEASDKSVTSISIQNASDITEWTSDGKTYSTVDVQIKMAEGSSSTKTDEEFILRKDSDGKWKILGWR